MDRASHKQQYPAEDRRYPHKPGSLDGSAEGKVVYVVSVPHSTRAPHMAADHRFYKRFNFESIAMEEYEVRDVSRRRDGPDLGLDLQWHWEPAPGVPIVELAVSIVNESPEPASHAVIRLYVDSRITIIDCRGFSVAVPKITADYGEVPVIMLSQKWSTPTRMPIWEGEPFVLSESTIKLGLLPKPERYVVGWRVSAPRMNTKVRRYSLSWNGRNIVVEE